MTLENKDHYVEFEDDIIHQGGSKLPVSYNSTTIDTTTNNNNNTTKEKNEPSKTPKRFPEAIGSVEIEQPSLGVQEVQKKSREKNVLLSVVVFKFNVN